MMLSRVIPSARPGARTSPSRSPSSSGPRWRIAATIARTCASACVLRELKATPQMPHTLFFDLRSRKKEGDTRAKHAVAYMKTRYSQPTIRIPAEQEAHHEEENHAYAGKRQVQKRLT